MNRWIVNIEEDPDTGDLMLPLPPEVLEALSLKTGDKINWNVQDNGSIIISKQETELVLVECINQFRTRYLVEVPKGKKRMGARYGYNGRSERVFARTPN